MERQDCGIADPGLFKLCPGQILGVTQLCAAQIGIGKIGAGEICIIEEGAAQIRGGEVGLIEPRMSKISA